MSVTASLQTAAAELRAAGYEPLEPYPGRVASQWNSRCTTCGAERRPSLHDIRKGKRCAHRETSTTPLTAAAEARVAGYEPLEPYPGNRTSAWRVRCTTCSAERTPTLKSIREGWKCQHRYPEIKRSTTAEEAAAELTTAGYDPLELYPGRTKTPWRVRCTTCGTRRTITLNGVRSGERCKHRLPPAQKHAGRSTRASLPADRIISRYRAGESVERIAKFYDISGDTVLRLLEDHGVPRRSAQNRVVFSPEIEADIAQRNHAGESVTSIAASLGVSRAVVRRVLTELSGPQRGARPDVTSAEIIERHSRGETIKELAAVYGVSRETIRRRLQHGR